VAADQLVDAVKKVLHEGNARRIVIKHDGRIVAEFPLTVGVVGAVVAPVLAAVGALAAVPVLPPGPVVVMCGHGERAMSGASLLARAGRQDAKSA